MPRRLTPGWRRGAGDPHGPYKVRGVNRSYSSVGLNSFGPNPTANLVGAKERGHSRPSGSVLGQAEIGLGGVERSAPPGLYLCGLLGVSTLLWGGQRIGPVTASPLWVRRCGAAPAFVVAAPRWTGRCRHRMPRRQSKTEAAISDEMMAFQYEFVGRGPDRIRTYIVEDLVVIRSFGVLTPSEKHLAKSFEGRRLIKAMRQQILEAGRSNLEEIVEKHTNAEVISVHSDISTKRGEWLDVFVLDRPLEGGQP